jgi:hypothetical protein
MQHGSVQAESVPQHWTSPAAPRPPHQCWMVTPIHAPATPATAGPQRACQRARSCEGDGTSPHGRVRPGRWTCCCRLQARRAAHANPGRRRGREGRTEQQARHESGPAGVEVVGDDRKGQHGQRRQLAAAAVGAAVLAAAEHLLAHPAVWRTRDGERSATVGHIKEIAVHEGSHLCTAPRSLDRRMAAKPTAPLPSAGLCRHCPAVPAPQPLPPAKRRAPLQGRTVATPKPLPRVIHRRRRRRRPHLSLIDTYSCESLGRGACGTLLTGKPLSTGSFWNTAAATSWRRWYDSKRAGGCEMRAAMWGDVRPPQGGAGRALSTW